MVLPGRFFWGSVSGFVVILLGSLGWWWQTNPERHLTEALRLLESSDPEQAELWLRLPENSPQTRDRALIARARVALARNRPDQAIAPLDGIASSSPSAQDADYWKGRTLYAMKSPKDAMAWFRRVLSRRPDHLEARRWLAAAAYDLGDWPTAVKAIEELIHRKPDDVRAWRTLGALFKEEGELGRAWDAYTASLRWNPHQPDVLLERAEVLLRTGRYLEGERDLQACRGHVAEARRLDLLAQCLRARGERDAALKLLDMAIATFPEHAGLLAQRALLAQVDRDYELALSCLDRALSSQPDDPQLLYQRGRVLRLLNRVPESERDLARASDLNQDMATMVDLNTKAIEQPNAPEIRCELGQLCIRLGMPELAGYWYRAALACDPTSKAAQAALQKLGIH